VLGERAGEQPPVLVGAVWGGACLLDAGLRVLMAFTLPIDLVPALDNVLLVVTLGAILLFQRTYGRRYLRRHNLQLRGVQVSPILNTRASREPEWEQSR
jgi:hypothetical protein